MIVPLLVLMAQTPEAVSLAGQPLFSPPASAAVEKNLATARAELAADPGSADKLIWVGRRLGYAGRYREAIDTFTQGITAFPQDARFWRHRGHRHISIRQFDKAIADFNQAVKLVRGKPDQIEPDGLPNKLNQPRSTLQFNIWYHLGLVHYLKGDFRQALHAFRECMKVSQSNDDSLVATSDWLYMTYRRLGRAKEAAAVLARIQEKMDIIENDSYHRRLLMYKGLRAPETLLNPTGADDLSLATQGYGVGNWYLYNGQAQKAAEIFRQVTAGKQWSAFGFIAAEAELARMK